MACLRRVAALLCALLAGAVSARAADRVTWLVTDFPPVFILHGAQRGTGVGDRTMAWFQQRLPDFEHETQTVPLQQVWQALGQADGRCYAAAVKSPGREAAALFSAQVYWSPTARIQIRKADRARFEPYLAGGRAIDLDRLLAGPLTGGVVRGRADVSRAAARFADKPAVVAADDAATLFRRLNAGDLDWILSYPWESWYLASTLGLAAPTEALPVAGEPKYLAAHFACSNQPLGRRIIAAIDRVIAEAGRPPPYFEFARTWTDPQTVADILHDAFGQ